MGKLRTGDGTRGSDMGPLVTGAQRDRVTSYLDHGVAAVAELVGERWLPSPFWAGPRTYGYEWVVLDDDAKRHSWLDEKEPPCGGAGLKSDFDAWLRAR
jgi:acyl-CoA reductase-like NAD-dependent aldehyde dehydrogenase